MKKLPFRIFLAIGAFLLTVLLYVDRACISAAKVSITHDLGLSKTQFGWILAVFTLGYALLQAPSGKFADKHGPRIALTSIITIWSVLTALTGAAFGFVSMLIMRFLFGVGQAGAFPALTKIVFNWFPFKERGIVQGFYSSGSRVGAAFALPLVAVMITVIGWRLTFLTFGLIGLVFALIWFLLFKDKPEESSLISEKERNYIIKYRQQPSAVKVKLPFIKVLASGNVWLAMGQYMCSNFTFYFTLTWMFPYIQERFSLGAVTTGLYSMWPLLAGMLGNWISGILVDVVYKFGNLSLSRKTPAITGFLLASFGMIMVTQVDSIGMAVFFMSVAVLGADMTLTPSWVFCIDIGKDNSGVVSGTMNMAGNLGAFVTIIAYPYLREWTGSNVPFFYTCAGLSIVAVILWSLMNPHQAIVKE
ncbi:MAG: MFS transporter [Fibrobacteria bacterium]|nr:MFS transporter [Fibrobacteria bacterium]